MHKRLLFIPLILLSFNLFSATRIAVIEVAEEYPKISSFIAKRFHCSVSSCSEYTSGTDTDYGHADKVTSIISNFSSSTEIYLFTGNSNTAFDWLLSNAETHNIRALNISADVNPNLDFSNLKSKGVYTIVSTGNGGNNGFNNKDQSSVNLAVQNPDVIGVAAGFTPTGVGTSCRELNMDGVVKPLPYDIRCNSNIDYHLHNFDTQHWGYVAQGCVNSGSQYGENCGTSFAAPRVAAAIGEILAINPSISETGLKYALDNSKCTVKGTNWARGISDGLYAEYTPMDPVRAINLAFGGPGCTNSVDKRVFPDHEDEVISSIPPVVSEPTLTIESLGCQSLTPTFFLDWASDIATPTYTVQWKRGSSSWTSLYSGSRTSTSYSGESGKVEYIRVRVFDPTKKGYSDWITRSVRSLNCGGPGGGFNF